MTNDTFGFPELMRLAKGVTGCSYKELYQSIADVANCSPATVEAWKKGNNNPTYLSFDEAFVGLGFDRCKDVNVILDCIDGFQNDQLDRIAKRYREESGRSAGASQALTAQIVSLALSATRTARKRTVAKSASSLIDAISLSLGFEKDTVCHSDIGYFPKGFETLRLYETLLNNASSRFWLFGRKNSKIFATESLKYCFRNIVLSVDRSIDLRFLFLDSEADKSVLKSAQNRLGFTDDLRFFTTSAIRLLNECGIDPSRVCRLYDFRRRSAIVVVDEYVFYREITYDDQMIPEHLTGEDFYYARVDRGPGFKYLGRFLDAWDRAHPINW